MEITNNYDKGKIIITYLKTKFGNGITQNDIDVDGVTYKTMDRGTKTTFYDEAGNTLFDMENERLGSDYDDLMNSKADEQESAADETMDEDSNEILQEEIVSDSDEKEEISDDGEGSEGEGNVLPVQENVPKNEGIVISADEKLKTEIKNAKDKSFAEPVIEYLLKRCEEDKSMAEDVCQPHKTWDKCYAYIYEQAKKQAGGNRQCAVKNDVVFEWAEDYYHQDDKALEEKKAKEAEERAKQHKETQKKQKEDQKKRIEGMEKRKAAKEAGAMVAAKTEKDEKKAAEVQHEKKPARHKKEMEGQFSLFDLM